MTTQTETNNNTDNEEYLKHSIKRVANADADNNGYHILFANMEWNIINANKTLGKYNEVYLKEEDEPVFIRDDKLVYLTKDAHGIYILKPVTKGKLNYILNRGTMWYKDNGATKEGADSLAPAVKLTSDFLESVLDAGSKRLDTVPEIRNIHSGALLNKKWEVVCKAGYDKSTKLYLTKNMPTPAVPDTITEEMVEKEKAMLWDIFKDFNFADMGKKEESVDYQNTIAALATAIIRPTWDGALPIWVVSKSSERTGGSLLQEIVGILACGEEQSKYIYPSRDDEYEKGINSFILSGVRYGMVDNVLEGHSWVTSALLVQSTGTGRTRLRMLGGNDLKECYPETFFALNGINMELRADIVGRIILTNIVPLKSWQELKYTRSEQALRDLAKWSHPDVVRAFAVFHKYWVQQGSPEHDDIKGNFDAYSEWCNVILAMLNCVGYHNVLSNLDKVQSENNAADNENGDLLTALFNTYDIGVHFSAKELQKKLIGEGENRKQSGEGDELLSAFSETIIKKAMDKSLSSNSVGMVLHHIVDRRVKGINYYLSKTGRQYVLKRVTPSV